VRELAPDVTERNYAKSPLTKAEVEEIVSAAPSIADVINTRHAIAKERGWKTTPPDKAALVAAALEENNLLRRPVTIRDGRAVVGSDEAALRALLA
jgi:arsenate reductase-like glutaredoxin family protein